MGVSISFLIFFWLITYDMENMGFCLFCGTLRLCKESLGVFDVEKGKVVDMVGGDGREVGFHM